MGVLKEGSAAMKKSTYLLLQLKRTMKIYPSVLIITLVTLCSIVLTAGIILHKESESADRQKMKVGLVGDVSDSYLGLGVYALKNMDSSRFTIDFVELNEEEAREKLKKRELTGFVQVPEDFVDSVAHGENVPADYITINAPESFGSVITGEITQTVSGLITRSQNAMDCMFDVAKMSGKNENMRSYIDEMTLLYAEQLLGRETTFNINNTGIKDSVSTGGYYICGVLMFLLLLWGISCNRILIKKNYAMSKMLYSRGIKTGSQIVCEYLGYFIVTFITFLVFGLIFGIVVSNNDFGVRELQNADVVTSIGFVIKIIPVIAMIGAMQMMLYEMSSGTVNAILLQFLTAVVLGYISGCFYPDNFFPEVVQKITSVLPSGVGFAFLRKSINGISVMQEFLISAIYTVIFLCSAVLIREYKMAGDEK